MELCDLGSLRGLLDEGTRLWRPDSNGSSETDFSAVLSIAADIAYGMAHLHSLNIIHSDLKVGETLRFREFEFVRGKS